ncbi:serine/threonine-protein phosphatase PGAM5, mitochondrial-like isoform X2 [Sycon ciliatum]|uniref:serine/threonine-protein phosphatase PGAM5, mitochondrial-like isoform X2 n=1 Tax=Sycon ciliatum TaxID=27933 RepID=UPI0031F6C017
MFGRLGHVTIAGAAMGAIAAGGYLSASKERSLLGTCFAERSFLPTVHAASVDQGSSTSAQPIPVPPPSFVPYTHDLPTDSAYMRDAPFLGEYVYWDENWDKRDPEYIRASTPPSKREPDGPELQRPTASRRIILIRHGQYNTSARSDLERTLTDLGHEQASATAARLEYLLADTQPSLLIHSTMTRAVQTFQPFIKAFAAVDSKSCDLLREGAPYPPEPPSKNYKPAHYFHTDGARIEAAYRQYFHRADVDQKTDSVEVIVCHANVIRYFVCRALQIPPSAWLRISLAHCSLTVLDIRPTGRVSLRALGDTGHLPRKLITFS